MLSEDLVSTLDLTVIVHFGGEGLVEGFAL